MGNRVKGKVKKKSIKAALSSTAGSKRKLSRMGKKQKKEHGGLEASFIGRSKCLKMLQIDLKDFRKLCILKGIYPREPLGKVPKNKQGQTFYHIKDIRAIAHEPILEKFREFKAFMKKVRRAAGRNERDEALRKNAVLPTYTLHHLVKERYPRFVDALSDLDDALTLIYLFAALPGKSGISPATTVKAKTLAAAWGAYCATTSSISKSFISVKGIYLEATIQGVPIRWITPHAFTQSMPNDVDFKIMKTFVEFYETLLNFVMFKLYNDIGVRYPFPIKELGSETLGSTSAVLGANLRALTNALNSSSGAISSIIMQNVDKATSTDTQSDSTTRKTSKKDKQAVKSIGDVLNKLAQEADQADVDDDDEEDDVDIAGPLKAALESAADEEARGAIPGGEENASDENVARKRLFKGLTFFLSREIPRGYLELISLSFGAKVGWEGEDSPISMKDPAITHHIVDRPRLPLSYEDLPKSREYIQPQWILDCANFMFILPISRYGVGATLPPHLSPWVDDEEEGYKPQYAEEIERLKNGEEVPEEEMRDAVDTKEDEMNAESETAKGKAYPSEEIDEPEREAEVSDAEEEEEEEDLEKAKRRQERKRKKEEEEAHALAKTMMSRKAQHLYGRMQYGIAKKQENIENLQRKRKELNIEKGKNPEGKTASKAKVERLKEERKTIEKDYDKIASSMKKSKKRRTK